MIDTSGISYSGSAVGDFDPNKEVPHKDVGLMMDSARDAL